jgi:hypothetical protein
MILGDCRATLTMTKNVEVRLMREAHPKAVVFGFGFVFLSPFRLSP